MRIVLHGNPATAGFVPHPRNGRCHPGAFAPPRGLDAERLFDTLLRDFAPAQRRAAGPAREQRVGLRVASWEQPDGWLLRAEVPGVPREQLEVTVEGNVLSVKATRSLEVPDGFRIARSERRGTEAVARLELPKAADPEHVEATLRDGVLEVRVLRREPHGRRVVPVIAAAASSPGAPGVGAEAPTGADADPSDVSSTR